MVKIALIGIITALLALWFKQQRPEYMIYLTLAASLLLVAGILSRIEVILESLSTLQENLGISSSYIQLLIKMLGITYLAELAADICKDAGCQALSGQINVYGKLLLMGLSMPVVLTLMDTITRLLPDK